MMADLNVDKQL